MSWFPVSYYLPKFAQVHVHWIGDVLQPSHPLSPSSPSREKPLVTYKRNFTSNSSFWRILSNHKGLVQHTQSDEGKKNLQPRLQYPGKAYCSHNVMSLHTCHNGYHEKNIKCFQRCGEKGIFVHCWWDWKLVVSLWKRVWSFL